jgi:hypothetical protein
MTTCSHGIPFEQKCPHCLAEGLAREAARASARSDSSFDYRGDAVSGPVMTDLRVLFGRVQSRVTIPRLRLGPKV